MGKKRNVCNIFFGNPEVRDHLQDQEIDKRMLNLDLKQVGYTGLNCAHVAQDRNQRQAVVNTVMNPNLT
jgi:hypothetical protein